jgi:hypothetical protein
MQKFKFYSSAVLAAIFLLCAVSVNAQVKSKVRYFQASYVGQDSLGLIRHGSYFFSTNNNYFPSIEETKAIVITGYKLNFTPKDARLTIWLTEFKTKTEWLRWYHE